MRDTPVCGKSLWVVVPCKAKNPSRCEIKETNIPHVKAIRNGSGTERPFRRGGHAEVEQLSVGADVLVHEACRSSAMQPLIAGTVFEAIFSYHADTVELGKMASRAGAPHVVLTHLIPPPEGTGDSDAFVQDLRNGGDESRITVGEDLNLVTASTGRRCSAS